MAASADFNKAVGIKKNNDDWMSSAEDNWMLVAVAANEDIRWSTHNANLVGLFGESLFNQGD